MKLRNEELFLFDIRESCSKIAEYINGVDEVGFKNNRMIQDAIVRNIEIIGEASKNVTEEVRNKYPGIPWREIMRMRDKIVHHYFRLDLDVVWKTATEDIPELLANLTNSESSS